MENDFSVHYLVVTLVISVRFTVLLDSTQYILDGSECLYHSIYKRKANESNGIIKTRKLSLAQFLTGRTHLQIQKYNSDLYKHGEMGM